jgi:hypothetical protein
LQGFLVARLCYPFGLHGPDEQCRHSKKERWTYLLYLTWHVNFFFGHGENWLMVVKLLGHNNKPIFCLKCFWHSSTNFHIHSMHLHIIKVFFYSPTDAQVSCASVGE